MSLLSFFIKKPCLKNKNQHRSKRIEDVVLKSGKKKLSLKEKVWRIELTARDIKNFFRQHRPVLITSLIALVIVTGFFGYLLITQADVANFYSTSCLGGWQNPQNAQGKPDVGENGLAEEFNENNSAVLKNVISQIFCGSFEGEIPENSQPKKVLIKFSWVVRTEEEILASEENSGATSTLIEIIETTSTIDIISTSTPETESTSSPVSFWHPIRNFISNGASKIVHLVFAEETSTPEIVIEIPVEESSTPPIIEEVNTTSSPIEPPEDPQTPTSTPKEIMTETATTTTINQTATSSNQEEIILATSTEEDLISTTTQETILIPENTATSTEEIATTTPITPSIPEPFLEILYTLDGTNWQSLGKVNRDNWQNLALEIPNFNWEDISKVQISIQSLSPVDFTPTVYLDGLWLEVEYETLAPKSEITVALSSPVETPAEEKVLLDVLPRPAFPKLKELLFNVSSTQIYSGECLNTSYFIADRDKNIYVYQEGNFEAAYTDFGGKEISPATPITVSADFSGRSICDITLLNTGVFHFLEVEDPERTVCSDNVSYENCRAKALKESVLEIKEVLNTN